MIRLYKHLTPEKDTTAADRGTDLHNHVQPLKELDGLNEYDRGQVEMCRGFVDELIGEQKTEAVVYEKHCKLFGGMDLLTAGTVDCVIIQEHQIIIIDWKFGQVPVTVAENNLQLLIYMLMVYDDFSDGKKPVVGYIVQPQLQEPGSRTVLSDPESVREDVTRWIRACQRPEYKLVPTDDGCRWCPVIQHCPAACELTELIPASADNVAKPEYVSEMVTKARIVEKYCSSWIELGRAMAEKGELPGYEIRKMRGNAVIENAPEVYARGRFLLSNGKELNIWPDKKTFMKAHLKIRKPRDLEEDFASRYQAEYKLLTGKKLLKKEAKAVYDEVMGDLIVRGAEKKQLRKKKE